MKPTDGKCQTEIIYRVKVSSPENINIERVDSFHLLEDSMIYTDKVRCKSFFRGLNPWYGTEWISQELGRACISFRESGIVASNPKRGGSGEAIQAVGLTHSRGITEVMPCEPFNRHSKGLAILRKGKAKHYHASQRS